MIYPFLQARYDSYGPLHTDPLAFVVHMAEGGNTDGYLSRDPARGVSVHFVVKYDGRIVQMLHLDRISGSINPSNLRETNDPPHTGYNGEVVVFGAAARRRVLGPTWQRNPNPAIITCEVEGFAFKGPNVAQRVALRHLASDLHEKLPSIRGVLGHRDFQDYKACPGKHINWASMAPTFKHG